MPAMACPFHHECLDLSCHTRTWMLTKCTETSPNPITLTLHLDYIQVTSGLTGMLIRIILMGLKEERKYHTKPWVQLAQLKRVKGHCTGGNSHFGLRPSQAECQMMRTQAQDVGRLCSVGGLTPPLFVPGPLLIKWAWRDVPLLSPFNPHCEPLLVSWSSNELLPLLHAKVHALLLLP